MCSYQLNVYPFYSLSLSWCLMSSFQTSLEEHPSYLPRSHRAIEHRHRGIGHSWHLSGKSRPHLHVCLGCIPRGCLQHPMPLSLWQSRKLEMSCVRTLVPLLNDITLAVSSGWLTVWFRWGSTEMLSQLHSLNSVSKCSWYFGNVQYIFTVPSKKVNVNQVNWFQSSTRIV